MSRPDNADCPPISYVVKKHAAKCEKVCTLWQEAKGGGRCRNPEVAWSSGRDPGRCVRTEARLLELFKQISGG